RQVADDVENFMPHKFVAKSQPGLVQHAVRRQHYRVVEGTAADQVSAAQAFDLIGEAEGARGGNLPAERAVVERNGKLLHANHRVREVNQAVDLIMIGRLNADASIT